MTKRIALLFSGQGAQSVGMGKDLAAAVPSVAALFSRADEILGEPLSQIAFEGPEADLTQTRYCQPALFVHGLAVLGALRERFGDFPIIAAAGLSLGEFTAHAAAGRFTFEDGLKLVAARGRFMQEACDQTTGSMAAILGGEESAVRAFAAEFDVDCANFNNPGQIVISGDSSKVADAVAAGKERKMKAIALKVAGAYHSRLMAPAAEKLRVELDRITIADGTYPVWCNVEARPVTGTADVRDTLHAQVTGSVLWAKIIERLVDEHQVETFLELGPGGQIAGMVSRTRKTVPCISISDCASLEAALEKLKA